MIEWKYMSDELRANVMRVCEQEVTYADLPRIVDSGTMLVQNKLCSGWYEPAVALGFGSGEAYQYIRNICDECIINEYGMFYTVNGYIVYGNCDGDYIEYAIVRWDERG